MSALGNIANQLLKHPLTQGNRVAAVLRFLQWQFATRIGRFAMVVPYVDDTVLVIRKGMAGATSAIYVGLMDPEDMSFVLHLLREDDLFGDIGANVGVYTVLASGVRRARSVAVEPCSRLLSTCTEILPSIAWSRSLNFARSGSAA